ncbi:MAG: HDOD domain-containing protein [Betaproteobacteria bacterium]|nr:HDOD domain-containing protein [Betaproteobacteria bacterium]
MLQQPGSLMDRLACLGEDEIPVLRRTARELARLRGDDALPDARSVADVVTDDPLMTVKLLRYMQRHKPRSQACELVDVKQALLMMGLDAFFRDVPPAPIVEEMLREPRAAVHFLHVVRRAQRAASYAFDWALRLHDMHAEEIQVSALLAHLAELLLWCFDPVGMLEARRLQAADHLRSAEAQTQALGFASLELQRRLAAAWALPGLLGNLEAANPSTRARIVVLAVDLARHSADGWDDAALPDDFNEIAALLHMEPSRVMALVKAGPAIA